MTTGVAFLQRMNAGIPGAITRQSSLTIDQAQFDATNPPLAYGVPVGYDGTSHNLRKIIASDPATIIRGILVRPFPQSNGSTSDGLGSATPDLNRVADVLLRGYVSVVCNFGTPAKDGTVYVRVGAPSGPKVIGGIEATSDSTNTVAIPNTTFTGGADASGNVEIAFNI